MLGIGGTLPRRRTRNERRGATARRLSPGLCRIGAARGDVDGSRRPLYDSLRAECSVQARRGAAGLYARRARDHARRPALRHDGQPATVAATTHRLGDHILFGGVRVSGTCAPDRRSGFERRCRWIWRRTSGGGPVGRRQAQCRRARRNRSGPRWSRGGRRPAMSARASNPSPSTQTRTPQRPSSRPPPTPRPRSRDSCRLVSLEALKRRDCDQRQQQRDQPRSGRVERSGAGDSPWANRSGAICGGTCSGVRRASVR